MGSEKELVLLAKSGDNNAFSELMQQSGEKIYNLCLRLTKNSSDARDLYQNSFIKAYEKLQKFKHSSSFVNWVYSITINLWKNTIRYEKSRSVFRHISIENPGDGITENILDTSINLESEIEKNLENEQLKRLIDELKPELKLVLILRDIEGRDYKEISEIVNCPLGTVKWRISRARQLFRKKLMRYLKDRKHEL